MERYLNTVKGSAKLETGSKRKLADPGQGQLQPKVQKRSSPRGHSAATLDTTAKAAAKPPAAVPPPPTAGELRLLHDFDMTSKYGPCVGVDRLVRYRRAVSLGLSPPMVLKALLEKHSGVKAVQEAVLTEVLHRGTPFDEPPKKAAGKKSR